MQIFEEFRANYPRAILAKLVDDSSIMPGLGSRSGSSLTSQLLDKDLMYGHVRAAAIVYS